MVALRKRIKKKEKAWFIDNDKAKTQTVFALFC